VNDVAAMKVADVGVALLNGYGHEGSHTKDSEDVRRREKLAQRKIGSNRKMLSKVTPQTDSFSAAGVGSSAGASTARVKANYSKALSEIQARALARMQDATEGHDAIHYNVQDMKDAALAFFRVLKEEWMRTKTLQKGGGAAARILADEDMLRRELMNTKESTSVSNDIDNSAMTPSTIKPGEASLAASFSCLRPSIDGVEALMRVGVSAAACALSVQQTIALNCLLSCYNLATLYRTGLRYGKHLWSVELFFVGAIGQASYQAYCTARPRLSTLRPEQSLFNPTSLLSVCTQAFVHLATLTVGVRIANALEAIYATPDETRSRVRWKENDHKHPIVLSQLARALAASPRVSEFEEKPMRGLNLLGRPPFRPNYATNIVFFLSIFQNAVSAIVTHKGKPFYGTLLESRTLCVSIGLALLFCVAGVSEAFPDANALLELRPLPSKRFKRVFLALFAVDFFGCLAAKWLFEGFREQDEVVDKEAVASTSTRPKSSAHAEEALLAEESKANEYLLAAMVLLFLTTIGTSAF
jgi:hypothetical protein